MTFDECFGDLEKNTSKLNRFKELKEENKRLWHELYQLKGQILQEGRQLTITIEDEDENEITTKISENFIISLGNLIHGDGLAEKFDSIDA